MSHATVMYTLEQYKDKVLHCRTIADVAAFERTITLG